MTQPHIPKEKCETCGDPTYPDSKLCNNCWEVEHRLDDYLKSECAREKVLSLIGISHASHTYDLRIAATISRLMEADPHQFSTLPCQTCITVSALLDRTFGCCSKVKK